MSHWQLYYHNAAGDCLPTSFAPLNDLDLAVEFMWEQMRKFPGIWYCLIRI